MSTVVFDSFDPRRGPGRSDLREVSDALLRQLVLSGSREAARELMRRRSRDG